MSPRLSKIVTRTGDDGTTGLGDGTRLPKDSARIEALGAVDELNSALGVLLAQPLPDAAPSPAPTRSTPAAVRDAPAIAGAAPASAPTREWLFEIQQRLFDLGGELAVPGLSILDERSVERLERRIEELNAQLPPLKEFVLPGGGPAAAACHLARAICRRAERRCWTLARTAAAPKTAAAVTKAAPATTTKSRTTRTANRTDAAGAVSAAVSAVSLRYLNRLSDFLFVLARMHARAAGNSEQLWQHERGRRGSRRHGRRG